MQEWGRQSQVSVTSCLQGISVPSCVFSCTFTVISQMLWEWQWDFREWKSKMCPGPQWDVLRGHLRDPIPKECLGECRILLDSCIPLFSVGKGGKVTRIGKNRRKWEEWDKISFVQRYFALTLRRNVNNSSYDKTGKFSSKDEIFWRLWNVLKPKNEAMTAFLALLDIMLPTCMTELQESLKVVFFLKLCLLQPNKKHLVKNYYY